MGMPHFLSLKDSKNFQKQQNQYQYNDGSSDFTALF